jgi:glycosyltransferase involved in cell wall biosynthesis
MRVAYICMDAGVPVFGKKGSSVHVQEVLRSLLKRGAEIDLFTVRLDGECPSDLRGVRVHLLPKPPKGDVAERERTALALNQNLQQKLAEHTFDIIYERYSLWSYAAIEMARERGIPSVLEVNAPLIEEQKQHRALAAPELAEGIATQVFSAASVVICVSQGVADYVKGYPGAKNVHVLPNGVNVSRFLEVAKPRKATNIFTIGFVGTLKPWHGVDILLESFRQFHRRYPKSRLLLVGDGPEREALEQRVRERKLDTAVTFTGAVSPELIPSYLKQMDTAVAPYPDLKEFYFSPLKILEYMAAGVPVVASRVGQIPDLIEHGVTGLLCPPGDADKLTMLLTDIFHQPVFARRLARAAREKVEREHSWDVVVSKMLELAKVNDTRNVNDTYKAVA